MSITKTQTIQKTPSYLPLFSGFYHTIWSSESQEEQELDWLARQDPFKNYPEDMVTEAMWDNIDYEGYRNEVSEAVSRAVCGELEKMEFISGYEYGVLRSPREYNFSNDSINLTYHLTDENINNIRSFILDHWTTFRSWIRERYSSRPGFIPSYSNDADVWSNETKEFTDWSVDGHRLGSVFEFIFEVEGLDECGVYYVTEYYLFEFVDQDGIINDLKDMVGGVEYSMSEFKCCNCGEHLNELNPTDENTITKAKQYRKLKNKTPNVLCKSCTE